MKFVEMSEKISSLGMSFAELEISIRFLECYCQYFSTFTARLEIFNQGLLFLGRTRELLLLTKWPAIVGLDPCAIAVK